MEELDEILDTHAGFRLECVTYDAKLNTTDYSCPNCKLSLAEAKAKLTSLIAQELDQALTKISFYHAIPKKELEKTIKEKL